MSLFEQAIGNGQSECNVCKSKGIQSLTWTLFLFKNKYDNKLYCGNCAKELIKNNYIKTYKNKQYGATFKTIIIKESEKENE